MKEDTVKLTIMSDGTVALNDTRITKKKMYGAQSVKASYTISRHNVLKALGISDERDIHKETVLCTGTVQTGEMIEEGKKYVRTKEEEIWQNM